MTTYPVMSTMGVGRGIVLPNDSVWRLQPPATNPRGVVELWNGNSGSTTLPSIMRTGVYGTGADGTVWEYAPPNLTKISTVFIPTTWNPSDLVGVTLSNGNLTAQCTTTTSGVRGATGLSSGKYYWEAACSGGTAQIGIGQVVGFAGMSTTGMISVNFGNGTISLNSVSTGSSIGSINGQTVYFAIDLTNNLFWAKSSVGGSVWNGSSTANPATGTGGISFSSLAGGSLYPAFFSGASGQYATAYFGASAFSGTVPSGFTAGWGATQ